MDAGAAPAGVDRVAAAGEAKQRRLYRSRPDASHAASSPISIFLGNMCICVREGAPERSSLYHGSEYAPRAGLLLLKAVYAVS